MTVAFTKTIADVAKKVLLLCRAYDPNQAINPNDLNNVIDTANYLIKSWQSQGYNLWLLRDAVMFLDIGKKKYQVGGDGDHICEESDFVNTTLATSASLSATTLSLVDASDMSGAPNIFDASPTANVTLWDASGVSKTASGDALTIINLSDIIGYVELEINDLIIGSDYVIYYSIDAVLDAAAMNISVSDGVDTLATQEKTAIGDYSIEFTATATTAIFTFQQTGGDVSGDWRETTFTVESLIDKASGDYIGIELTNGNRFWTRIVSITSNSVTILDAMESVAASTNTVYSYTTKIDKPMEIMDASYLSSVTATETPIEIVPRETYKTQTDKTSTGQVLNMYYQPMLTTGDLYVWNPCYSVVPIVKFGYMKQPDICETNSDEPMFPAEWYLPLAYSVAAIIALEYKTDVNKIAMLEQKAAQLLEDVLMHDNEKESLFLGVYND